MDKLAVGVIPFLNAKPIVYGLEMGLGEGRMELNYHTPDQCARLLAEGKLDLALVPAVEYAELEGLRILPGISIASMGEVASVLLLSKVPLEKVDSVSLDRRSRTSAALLQVLCAELYRISPKIAPAEPNPAAMLKAADAALVIGDEALYFREKVQVRRDLGEDWHKLTGQPFVFALWVGNEKVEPEDIRLLHRSLREGINNIHKIAANYTAPGASADLNERYLTENILYRLGDDELNGLKLFLIKAWENRLIEGVPRLHFYEG
jgi:chorismate dehydratase